MKTSQDIHEQLAEAYIQALPFRAVHHPRIFLQFSGMPGSGKTVLARRLATDLQAQYIRHDDIREEVRSRGINSDTVHIPSVSKLIVNFIMQHDNNKLIILDSSIDHNWQRYFEHVKELHALPLIIRMDVPTERIKDRIQARDGRNNHILEELDRYQQAFENCRRQVPADLIPRLAGVVAAHAVPVFLHEKHVRLGGMHGEAVHAVADLSGGIGDAFGAQSMVGRAPRLACVVGPEHARRRNGDEDPPGVGRMLNDRVQAHPAGTWLP